MLYDQPILPSELEDSICFRMLPTPRKSVESKCAAMFVSSCLGYFSFAPGFSLLVNHYKSTDSPGTSGRQYNQINFYFLILHVYLCLEITKSKNNEWVALLFFVTFFNSLFRFYLQIWSFLFRLI